MLFSIQRQQEIMNLLKIKKSATIAELSKKYFIGEATIRRDLDALQKMGLLKRTHGGAVLTEGLGSEIPLTVREMEQQDEKSIIGRLASHMVRDGDIIIMDSSSTTLKMVPLLKVKKDLTVITNGAKTAIELGDLRNIKIYCTGGILRENSLSYIGYHANSCINRFSADTLFFSCRSISMENGLYDSNEEESELRQVMIKNSRKVVLLCDSTKFDGNSYYKICNFDKIDSLITDRKPSDIWIDFFKTTSIELIY